MNMKKIQSLIDKAIHSKKLNKIVKISIIAIAGTCAVLIIVNALGQTSIFVEAVDKVSTVFNTDHYVNQFVITNYDMLNDSNVENGLKNIADLYNVKDMDFLKEVINTEKQFKLQPCELLSLLSIENSFTDKTVVESDGITSYNVSQMRFATALDAHRICKTQGINLPSPTDELLRNDKHYVIQLTAAYLKFLHERYPNPLEAWTTYNAGMGSALKFKSCGFIYKYTTEMVERIQQFTSLMVG